MPLKPILADNLTRGKHGFFSRLGGHSSGIYQGLNCGIGSNDDQALVTKNRADVARSFDLAPENLVSVYQIHSPEVVVVTEPFRDNRPKCDAMVTNIHGLALGILTADCAPVLFEDAAAGVVAAAHAGWRGANGGVLSATVDAMVQLGANPTNISATVGPCISQKAYEVGPEFFDEIVAEDDEFTRFFAAGVDRKLQFDLPGFAMNQLRRAGLNDVRWTGHCTYSDPEKFFSYRRTCHQNEPDYGRLISVICL